MVKIKNWILSEGARNRPTTRHNSGIYGHRNGQKYICIHNTGNRNKSAGAHNHASWLYNNPEILVGYHYTVDDEVIYKHIPLKEGAWHAGDGVNGKGNLHSIGIEIAENMVNYDYDKYLEAENNAAWLTAKLLDELDLTINDVKQHYDFNGKNCPSVIRARSNGWQEFLDKVKEHLDVSEKTKDKTLYRVIVDSRKDYEGAVEIKKKVKQLSPSLEPFIAYNEVTDGDYWYRVVAAERKGRELAERSRDYFSDQGFSAWLLSEWADLEYPDLDEPEADEPDPTEEEIPGGLIDLLRQLFKLLKKMFGGDS